MGPAQALAQGPPPVLDPAPEPALEPALEPAPEPALEPAEEPHLTCFDDNSSKLFRIFQLADYHTLQLEKISLLVHF